MSLYVLLFRKPEDPSQDDLDRISKVQGVRVLDDEVGRAMLLEGPDEAVDMLRDQLKDWIVARQVTYAPPEPATQHLERRDE